MKILLVKRDKIGDLLLATPMLAVLRRALPEARIEVLASDYNAWVLEGNADVDAVHVYRRTRPDGEVSIRGALQQAALWFQLRRRGFDVAIAANGEASHRAARRTVLLKARRTIAYAQEPVRGLTDALAPPVAGHERERLLGLLAPLRIDLPASPPMPRYHPPQVVLDEARAWLAERGLEPGGFIVIGLGSRRPRKQPSREQVLRWSAAVKATQGLDTVFMWTPGPGNDPRYPGDDALAQEVLAGSPPGIHPFRGPLLPAVGLVWQARASIFPDSGLMHFAAASPGGVLGLFAQTDVSPHPSQWGPLGEGADYLDAPSSVAELDDALVLGRLDRLMAREPADTSTGRCTS